MQHKRPIPHHFLWMTEGYKNRGDMFKQYVASYINKIEPGMELVKITGMTAICQRKGEA